MTRPLIAKRWQDRRQRWVAPGALFAKAEYSVDVIDGDTLPKRFIEQHHYAGTLRLHPEASVILHGVYVYSHPIEARTAPIIEILTDEEMAAKRRAIQAYKPSATSIGYGYRSVPELFDGAESDPREFLERVQ